jgi:hypothetical protein
VLAGVDDQTARRQFGREGGPIEEALAKRPPSDFIHIIMVAATAGGGYAGD